jgi:hypothetical protein
MRGDGDRNGLVVVTEMTPATGTAKREAAVSAPPQKRRDQLRKR